MRRSTKTSKGSYEVVDFAGRRSYYMRKPAPKGWLMLSAALKLLSFSALILALQASSPFPWRRTPA
jgi:hypothetical protein